MKQRPLGAAAREGARGACECSFDPDDVTAAQEAVRTLLPDATVVGSAGHDWVADPLAGETWPMLRPGQLTGVLPHVRALDGALRLAGSYAADGWAGFIDGALESGMTVARTVAAQILSQHSPDGPADARLLDAAHMTGRRDAPALRRLGGARR